MLSFAQILNLKKIMKRKVLSVIAIAAVVMTSCKKAEPANRLGTAVITGKITADLDLSNDVNGAGAYSWGFTPDTKAGIQVYAVVNTKIWDQTPDNNYAYEIKTFSTTTAADGTYSFSIPATDKPENITIKVGEFTQDQVQYAADGNNGSVSKRFYTNDRTVTIFNGSIVVDRIHMSEQSVGGNTVDVFGTYALSGTLFYNNNYTNDSPTETFDAIPAGYKIQYIYTTNIPGGATTLIKYADVAANGTYTIVLPTADLGTTSSNVTINYPDIVSTFTYDIGGGNTETIDYVWQINSNTISVSNGNASIIDRTFN
jgi:hypothetical protein